MDGLTRGPTVLRFGPDRRWTAAAGTGAVVATGFAATGVDGPGRLMFAVAALLLACYTVGDLLFWPRLVADRSGLRIRTPLARAELAWSEVEAVRADVRTRYGLRSAALEVDAGARLVVFSRRSLGADPEQVLALLLALAPPRR